jgi:cbb3-type cytochrome oxidase subunit 3
MDPMEILGKAADLGGSVFIAVISLGMMAWMFNKYDKRRVEEAQRDKEAHILERQNWLTSIDKIACKLDQSQRETSDKIVDKVNDVIREVAILNRTNNDNN